MSHGRVTLKIVEVIVYPQQDYPCNLQESKGNMSIVVDVLVGHRKTNHNFVKSEIWTWVTIKIITTSIIYFL